MDSFVVSARKYRPSTFKSVVGQDALTTTLKNAIKTNKLAHAYLFCGPRGVGKTTCARIFAKTINCSNLTADFEACNECESCKTFNEQRSYNIHELDAASNNGVDDIRSLTDQVRIPPQIGSYSVYIIDEVHMLSQGAFNAFLKTLEEPPAHAIFILATTEKHKIIPTILSRCQIYDFNRISIADTVNHLKYVASQEGVTIDENALNIIARKSDGGMRDALSIFDQLVSFSGNNITYESTIENLNILDYEYYFRLVDKALEGDVSAVLMIFNEVLNKGFDAQHFITGLSSHLRDVLVSKDPITIQLLEVGADIGEKYKQQTSACSTEFLFNALNISNECDLNYRLSKNKRLLIELALIKICQLSGVKKQLSTNEEPAKLQKVTSTSTASEQKQQAPTPEVKPQAPASPQPTEKRGPIKTTTPPPAEKSIPKPPSGKFPPSVSISLSSVKTDDKLTKPKSKKTVDASETTPFTGDDLLAKWENFAKKKELDPGTKAFLQTHLPTLKDDNIIEVMVDNKFQEKELIQMGIANYLRKELNNNLIELKIGFTPETEFKRQQTPQEIYKRMAEEFPLVEKLRKSLDMEID
ncbi:MAG: DNA polymerase III subunit gamma/tau [Bacteroidales bacterium]|nr:DNA polymerase III subunit gamma/tau [Bacteroidales bacterium]